MHVRKGNNTAAPAAQPQKAWRTWTRRILAGFSLFSAVLLFLLLVGVLLPSIPYLGVSGTILESFFSLHLVIASVIVGLVASTVFRQGGKRVAVVGLCFSFITTLGFCIPLVDVIQTAGTYHTSISWSQNITGGLSVGTPDLAKSVQFATTPDGKALWI